MNTAVIQEWDGTLDSVEWRELGDGSIEIVYQDGLAHVVSKRYFESIRQDVN